MPYAVYRLKNYHSTTLLTNLLFKWTDVPPVESENIQQASSIKYIFLPRLITGQSCQCIYKNNIHVINMDEHWDPAGSTDSCHWLFSLPLRSWSSVMESWLSLHDWIGGEPENFSSHLMKDGHAANPWSKEFRKQVLPKFNSPGTIPAGKHRSLLSCCFYNPTYNLCNRL